MAKKTLCSKCKSYRRYVVWMIDRRFFCQSCAERTIESFEDVTDHQIFRLSENEADYERREQKEASRQMKKDRQNIPPGMLAV